MTDQEVIEGTATEIVPYEAPAPPATLFHTDEPGEVIVKAAAAAKPLAEVIRKQKLYKTIQGKNHVFVEGWTLLGSMFGVFPVIVWTKKLDNGWEARAEARTMAGVVVGAAEAQCLRTEARWKSADDYAIRSMAQTRATSRAMRGPLGFVIQLAGFQPDPAEDMPGGDDPPAKRQKSAGEPRGSDRRAASGGPVRSAPAVAEASSEERAAASPAESSDEGMVSGENPEQGPPSARLETPSSESPFKPPTGPRGGQATQIEANELAEKLCGLVERLGATDSLEMVESKREAADVVWLKRQITTAEKALARREEEK